MIKATGDFLSQRKAETKRAQAWGRGKKGWVHFTRILEGSKRLRNVLFLRLLSKRGKRSRRLTKREEANARP